MHSLAKRIHNIAPRDVCLTLADGSMIDLEMQSAEFFQEAFQAEGIAATGTRYRLVTDGDDDPLVAGRETDSGWVTDGTVVDVGRAEA